MAAAVPEELPPVSKPRPCGLNKLPGRIKAHSQQEPLFTSSQCYFHIIQAVQIVPKTDPGRRPKQFHGDGLPVCQDGQAPEKGKVPVWSRHPGNHE